MIKNKKLFAASLALIVISIALNFPFPHQNPLGEAAVMILNIPIKSADGFQNAGVFTLLLLVLGMVFLHRSLEHCREIVSCHLKITAMMKCLLLSAFYDRY
ncbi:hypothetical protein [Cytobacillus firmus]|uniref:hypothetical protein n=1 Tax=Cytobacillus firmus TaxID=1399 RepID=UPI00222844A6|nr:hypothetical protein [Cytobacillus firmus]